MSCRDTGRQCSSDDCRSCFANTNGFADVLEVPGTGNHYHRIHIDFTSVLPLPLPPGAFYSFFYKYSFFQMYLDKGKCIDCKNCERSCPMGVGVTKNLNCPECIRCGACKSVCPTGAISSGFEIQKERMPN